MDYLIKAYFIYTMIFLLYMGFRWSTDGVDGLLKVSMFVMGLIGLLLNLKMWGVSFGL